MIIAVASGKGGTGKTTVAVNFALSIDNAQLLDCDVEEPNSHLFLKPEITDRKKSVVLVPRVNHDICTYCQRCREVCAYGAIAVIPPSAGKGKGQVLIFDNLCHSCGACVMLCPEKAMFEEERETGIIETGKAGKVDFTHGRLNLKEAMSPPLIKQVKKGINKEKISIIDSPPGTSCPVIASVKGADFVLLVTEPTPFGLNDLKLAVETVKTLNLPVGIVINRSCENDHLIEDYSKREKIPVMMKIPFDRNIAVAYSKGINIVEVMPEYMEKFKGLLNLITSRIAGKGGVQ
ncbi:MAG: ATP-binding protein [Candidatus Goldbacteria bacterium]|nr:ATP-binding protein [Candidatus Goldiibacteriota bacterium]